MAYFVQSKLQGTLHGADKVICYPTSYQDAYTNRGKGAQYDAFWNAGNLKGTNLMLQDSLNPFYNNQTNCGRNCSAREKW